MTFKFSRRQWLNGALALTLIASLPQTRAAQTITLTAEDDWFPFTALRNGQVEGFSVDVIRAAYAAVGVDVKFNAMPFNRCLAQVEFGTDLGCFNIVRQSETEKRFLFHKVPLFKDIGGIYDMEKSGLPSRVSPKDLIGHRVGYTLGDTYGDFLDKAEGIRREMAPTKLLNLKKLTAGRQEYSLISVSIAAYLFKTYEADFPVRPRLVGVVSEQEMHVGFSYKRPDSAAAAGKLDAGLLVIRKNGTYKMIEDKWLGEYPMLEDVFRIELKK